MRIDHHFPCEMAMLGGCWRYIPVLHQTIFGDEKRINHPGIQACQGQLFGRLADCKRAKVDDWFNALRQLEALHF